MNHLIFTIDPNTKKALSVKKYGILCNLWGCPYCGPRKAIYLKYLIVKLAVEYNLDHFLTITLVPSNIPSKYKGNTGMFISYLFNRFRLWITRKYGKDFLYIWVKQYQSNGNAHLHMLIHGYFPIKSIRREWKRIGGGTQMVVKYLKKKNDIENVSRYISNYLIKGVKSGFGYVYGERRYGVAKKLKDIRPIKNKVKNIARFSDLSQYMSIKQFFEVYDMLYNNKDQKNEIVLNSYQESMDI